MRIAAGLIDIAALIDKKFYLLGNFRNSFLAKKFDQIMPKNIQQINLALLGFLDDLLYFCIRLEEYSQHLLY